jgi:hypothetical protein
MRVAQDKDHFSFHAMNCIGEVDMSDAANGSNLVTTRWYFTIKTKEDGTKICKSRLVARGFEDNEKRVSRVTIQQQPTVLIALFYRFWRNGSGRRPLGTLKQLFYKESMVYRTRCIHLCTSWVRIANLLLETARTCVWASLSS